MKTINIDGQSFKETHSYYSVPWVKITFNSMDLIKPKKGGINGILIFWVNVWNLLAEFERKVCKKQYLKNIRILSNLMCWC